jgi:MAF protein
MQGVENPVEVLSPNMDEGPRRPGELTAEYVSRLSREKAETSIAQGVVGTILAADTTVVLDDEVMGKPETVDEARQMLKKLRGRVHNVLTGVTVRGANDDALLSGFRSTSVHVREYSESEMEDYLNSGTPMDRAGAYGVQDMPFNPVAKVDGCFLNVVGLPLCTVITLMENADTTIEIDVDCRVPYIDRCNGCEVDCKEAQK